MSTQEKLTNAKKATTSLAVLTEERINAVLLDLADTIVTKSDVIIQANKYDLARMDESDPKYDRLLLNTERIEAIAGDIRNVTKLESPCGEILESRTTETGLNIQKRRVPIGVIGVIYEARPNVTLDVFSLCFKTQNVCILKGGSDAADSNLAIVKIIQDVLKKNSVDINIVQLLSAERSAALELMQASDYVDVLIPRGSKGLINFVRENSSVPVIETGAGIVHTYVDKYADLARAKAIVTNAKTRRVSVCNALDCMIIHKNRLNDLPQICEEMIGDNVIIFADKASYEALKGGYPEELLKEATAESFGTEFLSYKMSIKTVDCLDEALAHIREYSSKHSEAIVTEDRVTADAFAQMVDAAAVYINTSTAFTDGAQFGLGAEIGISTQKLHARGPMALKEITSYKWVVSSEGLTRS